MKIIIRADDLGYSEAVNYGIEKTVKEGIIKNVGFMVNMDASEHGIKLIEDEDICIGQHTNICVGKPLSKPEQIPSLVSSSGEFKTSSEYRTAKEDFVVLEEAILETEAQYEKFKQLTGREPDYFEGHAIDSPVFLKALEIVAERNGLKFSGFSVKEPLIVNHQKVYVHMNPNDSFSVFDDMIKNPHEDGYDMLILHPGYIDKYLLDHSSMVMTRPLEIAFACSQKLKNILKENNVKLYTYKDI